MNCLFIRYGWLVVDLREFDNHLLNIVEGISLLKRCPRSNRANQVQKIGGPCGPALHECCHDDIIT